MDQINPDFQNHLANYKYDLKPLEYYTRGIVEDRNLLVLSEAITILESRAPGHKKFALEILSACFPHRHPSRRIAITGSPGVGKSTFIEKLGRTFADKGQHLAILTIDPSSERGKGSILGDKTRMPFLTSHPNVYIRPSPAGKHLGGTHENTFECIVLCEAAKMDYIIVETVGVGQSEQEVKDFTDLSILLLNPTGGDELQGIKKGIVEIADIAVVNKADGERLTDAKRTQKDFKSAFQLIDSEHEHWKIPVILFSSVTQQDNSDILNAIDEFFKTVLSTNQLNERRIVQSKKWILNKINQIIVSEVTRQLNDNNNLDSQIKKLIHPEQSPFKLLFTLMNQLKIRISFE